MSESSHPRHADPDRTSSIPRPRTGKSGRFPSERWSGAGGIRRRVVQPPRPRPVPLAGRAATRAPAAISGVDHSLGPATEAVGNGDHGIVTARRAWAGSEPLPVFPAAPEADKAENRPCREEHRWLPGEDIADEILEVERDPCQEIRHDDAGGAIPATDAAGTVEQTQQARQDRHGINTNLDGYHLAEGIGRGSVELPPDHRTGGRGQQGGPEDDDHHLAESGLEAGRVRFVQAMAPKEVPAFPVILTHIGIGDFGVGASSRTLPYGKAGICLLDQPRRRCQNRSVTTHEATM